MASFSFSSTAVHHRAPKPLLLLRPNSPSPKPSFSTSFSLPLRHTSFSILASSSPPNHDPPSSLFKHICITLTAASALLLASFHGLSPPVSHASVPAAESDTLPSEDSKAETPLTDEEKERILEEHLDQNPESVKGLRALMELKIKAEKFHEAAAVIDRLELLIPSSDENNELHLLKAHLLAHAGDLEDARAGFDEILQKDPFLVEAYHGLVMVAGKYADAEEGKVEMEHVITRIEDAMEKCRKAKRKEDTRDFKLLMGQIKVMEGKYDDAIGVYEELVKEEPRDFRPYLCQGIVYSVLKKKGDAEKQFEKYRRLVPRGHPYAKYFDENVVAMKVFGQMEEEKKENALRR